MMQSDVIHLITTNYQMTLEIKIILLKDVDIFWTSY